MADLTKLSQDIKGDVITQDHPEYQQALKRWACNAERKAKVVVFVKDAQDVVQAIRYAREHSLPIAIRGGGHHPAGPSSVENGLVIDLSRYINSVTIDAEKKLAYVGGGAIWETVDKAAIQHGLASVAGTVNHTGVGGLLLGGGYGWLAPAHGLVVDNVVQATVVTADGPVLTANADTNPDLFFGIRGGGCNFGVATEFVLKLHDQRRTVFAGALYFLPSALEAVMRAITEWWGRAGENEAMVHVLTTSPENKQPIIGCMLFYNGTAEAGRKKFKGLYDLGPVKDFTSEIPYECLNAMINPMVPPGMGRYMMGTAQDKPHYPSVSQAFDKAVEISEAGIFTPTLLFEYYPNHRINAVPANAMAFRRGCATNVVALLDWMGDGEDRSDVARPLVREITNIVKKGQASLKFSESLGYSNFDHEGVSGNDFVADKAKHVFGENYSRLQVIKRKYDPDNIFNRWFPIAPLVGVDQIVIV